MTGKWIICGGGLHGVHLAAKLIAEMGVTPKDLQIIDPGKSLLATWRGRTKSTGMLHLRSPSVHHLDLDPYSLQKFAHQMRRKTFRPFAAPYQRPSLSLFDAHCDRLVSKFGLENTHIRDKAISIRSAGNHLEVTTAGANRFTTDHLILALGSPNQLSWPKGAPTSHSKVQHIFCPDFAWPNLESADQVLVIGGGITAAQVAIKLIQNGQKVHVISRHPIREHQFDSDPGWLGPKYMRGFSQETCMRGRRKRIDFARYRGSMPADLRRTLRQFMNQGKLHWHQGDIQSWHTTEKGVSLQLSQELILTGDHVLLATGFHGSRPGGSMVDDLVNRWKLPVAPCGYPIVDKALRWHPHIFVSGGLAELELGPVARNIAGARLAGDRIVKFLKSSE